MKIFISILIAIVFVVALVTTSLYISINFGPISPPSNSNWANFWAVFSNLTLLVTLLIVAYYTYETQNLRKATVESNALSFRPILVFNAGPAPFCTVTNEGNGPALNVCLIIWDGKKMKITSDNTVPGIIPTKDSYHFNSHVDFDSAGFKVKLPGFSTLIERITKTQHSLFCLAYRDLIGNKFYSIINGTNEMNYEGVFEHGSVF